MRDNTSLPSKSLLTCPRRQGNATTSRPASASRIGRAAGVALRMGVVTGVSARSVRNLALASVILLGALFASEPADDGVHQVELANALVDRGDLDQAEAAYTRALDQAQVAGDSVRAAGVVLHNIGRLLDRRGRQLEAERAYLRAVQAFSGAGVTDERLVVRAYAGLSAVYIQTGQYSKAEGLIRRVLTDHAAGDDSDRTSLMGSLGVVLTHKNRSAEAEQVLRSTVQQCVGRSSVEMQEVCAIALANLAGLQMRRARTAEAIDSYRQAVAMMEAVPTPSPATLCMTLGDYAMAVRGAGDHQTAEQLYRRAITLAKTRLGPGHVILAELLQRYGELARDAGRKSEARKLIQAARRIESEWSRENVTGHTVEIDTLFVRR